MALEARLNARCDAEVFEVRWSLRCLRSGLELGRQERFQQWSASTRKVSVMMALLAMVQRGKVSLDRQITYTHEMGRGVQSGTFQFMTPGFTFSLRDAMANMIITSDNVCTNQVFLALGDEDEARIQVVNDYCRAIGLRDTVHRFLWQNTKLNRWHHSDEGMTVTSALDQVNLLTWMVEGSRDPAAAARIGVTPELCAMALDFMRSEFGLSGMGAHLPHEAAIGAKAGRDVRGRSHIGVIYQDGAPLFVFSAFTDWVPTELLDGSPGNARALELIADLVRIAWDDLSAPSRAAA